MTEAIRLTTLVKVHPIATQLHDAETAFVVATDDEQNRIIHPGAFLVFVKLIREILNETAWIEDIAENADNEAFAPSKEQKTEKESEVNHD